MAPGQLISAIIIAIGLVVAAIAFSLVGALLQTADGGADLRLQRLEQDIVVIQDASNRIEGELSQTRADLGRLREDMSLLLANRTAEPVGTDGLVGLQVDTIIDEISETEELTETMKLAKARFNKGISQPNNRVMRELMSEPRSDYGTNCQSVTNENLKALLQTATVANFRATMVKPAIASLERIMVRLKESDPDIYEKVGTAGALCVRLIRGSTSSVSNHSWGTAIDLKLQGEIDRFADGSTQFGLLILAEYFNDEGWFWGATYSREDSMHFEVGVETLRRWASEGQL